MSTLAVPDIFRKHEATANAYKDVVSFATTLGKCTIEEKKTCTHLVAGKGAFLGIHPRKAGLRITIVLNRPIESGRIVKCEKASANRYYVDLDVLAENGLDEELRSWISEAYKLK